MTRIRVDSVHQKTVYVCDGIHCEETVVKQTTPPASKIVKREWFHAIDTIRNDAIKQWGRHFCSEECFNSWRDEEQK